MKSQRGADKSVRVRVSMCVCVCSSSEQEEDQLGRDRKKSTMTSGDGENEWSKPAHSGTSLNDEGEKRRETGKSTDFH